MALNLVNLRTAIQAMIGDKTTTFATEIDRAINIAGQDLVSAHDWSELDAQAVVLTVAPYTTGTVTVTNGSTTVTGSGTTFTSAMAGRRFALSYNGPFYEISDYVSTTELTLSEEYAEDTAAGETYIVYQDRYSLASDCQKLETVRIQKSGYEAPSPVNRGTLDEIEYLPGSAGTPTMWAYDGLDSSGYVRIIVRPVPSAVLRIHYRYRKVWTDLSGDSDLPVIAEPRRNLIIEHALWHCYSLKKSPTEAALHRRMYEKMLSDAKANEAPVEEEIEHMQPFDRVGGRFSDLHYTLPTDDAS